MFQSKIIRPKKPLTDYTDIKELEQISLNARRKGDVEYAEMAEQRMAELQGNVSPELRRDFNRAMEVYESYLSEKNQKNTRASRTLQKVNRDGIRQAIIGLVKRKDDATGFVELVAHGGLKDTFEAVVVKHAAEFPPDVVEAARARIARYGGR